ncbi:putative glycoside hydrolase [Bacteroides faecis]|nr:hypothetical protein [Bacteroides faecis]MCS2194168.1 putative glycoside hydrolase [Bacteroides faecis]
MKQESTHLVLDIKDNTGEVLYPSKYAAQKKNWKNFDRPDFDFINTFIKAAHAHGMVIFAGMNIFADGQNIVKRGAVFDKHKKWQAINYVPRKGLLPVTEIEGKTYHVPESGIKGSAEIRNRHYQGSSQELCFRRHYAGSCPLRLYRL